MEAGCRRAVVMALAMGLAFVVLASEARARSGALGRGDISALRAKLRKPQARARLAVLSKLLLRQRTKPVVIKALAPVVRRLAAKDKSCEVRVEATRVLIWRRSELGKTPRKQILKALTDPCPLANTSFIDWARHLGRGYKGTVVKGLSQLADKSPTYYVRCRALLKLGALRVKRAGRWRNAEDRLAVNLGLGLGTVKWLRGRKAQAPRLRVPPRRAPPRRAPPRQLP